MNHYRHRQETEVICANCGELFYRKRSDKIKLFCSKNCKKESRQKVKQDSSHNYYYKMKTTPIQPKIGTIATQADTATTDDFKKEYEEIQKLKNRIFHKPKLRKKTQY